MMKSLLIVVYVFTCTSNAYNSVIDLAHKRSPKKLNFMVYFSVNNNLYKDCLDQMRQMTQVASLDQINILVQCDEYNQDKVKRYCIEQGNALEIESVTSGKEAISGTPESLVSFVTWGMSNFPAESLYLVISGHGEGIKDRFQCLSEKKGVAFNWRARCYLTNQDLEQALKLIVNNALGGKKIPLLIMDSCFMSMLEICSQIKDSVDVLVASQDIEPICGYDYVKILSYFMRKGDMWIQDVHSFAEHMVTSFIDTHKDAENPATQAAIDLSYVDYVEENLTRMAILFVECITTKKGFFDFLKMLRLNHVGSFQDPDYIDLYSFYESLMTQLESLISANSHKRREIFELAQAGLFKCRNGLIIANGTGSQSRGAHGLSLYFPQFNIHHSYYQTLFDQKVNWSSFLRSYILTSYASIYKDLYAKKVIT